MSMKGLESIDSGSNYSFGNKMTVANNPTSLFDQSCLTTTTIKNGGILVPLRWFEGIPGDNWQLSIDALLRCMPQVVPLYSRQRMYIYAFYSRYSDLMDNWEVFMSKGYNGNTVKSLPTLSETNLTGADTDKIKPDSLGDYLELPIGATRNSLKNAKLHALANMMYLRIKRDYFMNKNYYINDRIVLPDDDSRFRLGDDGNLLSARDLNKQVKFDIFSDTVSDLSYDSNGNLIVGLCAHEYPSDRFTSALPWTQRGNAPTIDIDLDFSKLNIDPNGFKLLGTSPNDLYPVYANAGTGVNTTFITSNAATNNVINNRFNDALSNMKITSNDSVSYSISLDDIRNLAIAQLELEKMARTDGSYAEFGLTFFGVRSKNALDFRPTYIGGTYKNITFTEVLQTSGSSVGTTDPSKSSPLGAQAGHGITGISNGYLGNCFCDDYGIIMVLACIMPDIYYSQGIDKKWTRNLQSDFYLPERAKLGMTPVLNKELYYAGNNGNQQGDDNYLWAYQNPYDELRYSENKIHGKIADSNNLSFYPYTQARNFTKLPNWGKEFALANDIRKDYLFAPSEDAYSGQFQINARVTRQLPYKPVPAQVIN